MLHRVFIGQRPQHHSYLMIENAEVCSGRINLST